MIAWPYPLNILSDCQCSFSLRSKRFRTSYCMVRKLEWGRNNGGRETGRGEGETFFLVYPSPLCSFSLLSFQLSNCSCWNVTRIMFAFVGGSSCKNRHVMCATWAGRGECRRNPGYMTVYCKKSCRVCWGKSRRNIRPLYGNPRQDSRDRSLFFFFFGQWNLDSLFQSSVGFRIPQGVLPISKLRIWDSRFDEQKFSGLWNPYSLTRGVCTLFIMEMWWTKYEMSFSFQLFTNYSAGSADADQWNSP